MPNNPHAVALGRLGGRAGGRKGGLARAAALSADERKSIARAAAAARWAFRQLPDPVARLLKSYDVSTLKWSTPEDRWVIVSEVIARGDDEARAWLEQRAPREELRSLARSFRGAGLNEPGRAEVRRYLDLTEDDIPSRAFLGFAWR